MNTASPANDPRHTIILALVDEDAADTARCLYGDDAVNAAIASRDPLAAEMAETERIRARRAAARGRLVGRR